MADYARSDAKTAARAKFTGIWGALTTPFDARGDLDLDAVATDIRYLIDDIRLDGVFSTGVMGEFWSLTGTERKKALEAILDATQGEIPVLAHTGHHAARETIDLTRHAEEAGADFVVVMTPYYPAASLEGLRDWYRDVISHTDLGVWLFDTNFSGVTMPMELIDELADIENVCGIKVGHDHARYLETLNRVGDRILVCEANEGMWLENMRDHGQTVYMSSALPFLYQTKSWQPMREYTELALRGEFEAAADRAATLEPLRALNQKWLHGRWTRDRILHIPFIKFWSQQLGMAGGDARAPMARLTDAERAELRADLAAAGLLQTVEA